MSMPTVELPAPAPPGEPEPLGHVAPLDGLRALAVAAVVVYHAGFDWLPGGFLGVSAFFTLSGFLITSLLLREWQSSGGSVDLRRFWRRRFRRLLPASWVTLGFVLALGAAGVWNSDQLRAVRGDVPFALAEVINWHFIAQDRSYGADFAAPSPLEHFWSLAVEQQFYVVLPLLVVAVFALGRRWSLRRRVAVLAAVFVALAVVSAASNALFARTDVDRAYFGTDSRMAEMLIGSLLACATLWRLRLRDGLGRRVAIGAGVVALVVSGWLWHSASLDMSWLFPWGLLLSAACTAALVFAAIQGGRLGAALSLPPLVWLGRISYGVYLLHWPVFLWLTPARVGWSPWPLFGLRMAVTVVLAAAMLSLVEDPVRHGRRLRAGTGPIVAGLAAAALLLSTAWVTRDLPAPSRLMIATQAESASPTTVPPPTVRVAVVGDQVAAAVASTLEDRPGLEVSTVAVPDCGLVVGGFVALPDGSMERDVQRCRGVPDRLVAEAAATDPDVVLVVATVRDAATRRLTVDDRWAGPEDPRVAEFMATDVAALVDDLSAGAAVAMVTLPPVANSVPPAPVPPPAPNPDPAAEALLESERASIRAGAPAAGFAENDPPRVAAVNSVVTSVAAQRGVPVLDLATFTSGWPGGALDPRWRAGGVGFSDEGADALAEWLVPQVRELRAAPAPPAPPQLVPPDAPLPPAPQVPQRGPVPPGESADVLVVGDSVAYTLGWALEEWGGDSGEASVVTAAQFGCAVARGGAYKFQGDQRFFEDRCDWGRTYPGLVAAHRPDVVVLSSGIWEVVDRQLVPGSPFRSIGEPDVDRFILGEFVAAIDALSADGAQVVVTTQPRIASGLDQGLVDLPESEPARIDRLNELLAAAVAARPGVASLVDLRSWVASQPGGEMDPAMRSDGIHFSDTFAPVVASWLGPEVLGVARGG